MRQIKQIVMSLAALLMCAMQANAQTAKVADKELVGAWTLEWMQYDGEKKIMCGKANGYTQFKFYGANGEYAAAGIALSNDGKIVVIPQEYGTYSLKDGWYMEMGRPALKNAVVLTDKTHYRGRWKNRSDSWVDCCKMKKTPSDVQQLIKQNMFK